MGYIPNPIPLVMVKVLGYTATGAILNKIFQKEVFPPLFGITRTGAGLILGLITIPLALLITPYVWYVVLRIGLWYLLIWYFYERAGYRDKKFLTDLLVGLGASFVLDGVLYLLSFAFPDLMSIPWC